MKTAQITNVANGVVLASRASVADNFVTRLKGLIGKTSMSEGEALVIYPCSMVHCVGITINIDVLFVTEKGQIVKIISSMRPGKVSPYVRGARYVVELPPGHAAQTGTKIGDWIELDYAK